MKEIDKTRIKYELRDIIVKGLKIEDGEPILTYKAFKKILKMILNNHK